MSVQPPPAAEPSGGTLVVSVPSGITRFDPAVAYDRRRARSCSAICSTSARTIPTSPDWPACGSCPTPPAPSHRQRRRPLLHVRDPPGPALLAAVERARHRANLQAHDRAQSQPTHLADGTPGRCSSATSSAPRPTWPARRAHRRDSARAATGSRSGSGTPAPDLPARLPVPCSVRSRATCRYRPRLRPVPVGRSLLRRGGEHRAQPTSFSATRTTTATGPGGRDGSRSSSARQHPLEPDRGLEARLRDRRRPRRPERAARTPLRRGQPGGRAGGSATSSTPSSSRLLHLNTTRPLFASARMRRAANYAVDRRALAATAAPSMRAVTGADVHTARRPGLSRRAHLSAQTRCRPAARQSRRTGRHTALTLLLSGRR